MFNSNKESMESVIDLLALFKILWKKKWFLLKVVSLFSLLGLIIAFTTPEEYRTYSALIPEAVGEESKLSGSLGGLASLAGVDIGGMSGSPQTINPALYQSVSRSTPFLLDLMSQEYYFEEMDSAISIENYFLDHYKVGILGSLSAIPGKIVAWIGMWMRSEVVTAQTGSAMNGVLSLSKEEENILENLKSRIFVEMDWELNLVTINVEMQDPLVAAKMTQFTREYITSYVTDYSISKSKQQLQSITLQFEDRKEEFEKAQFRLASFRDKNQNVNTARAKSEEERLQSEYNLAFNVYDQLAKQREAIKLKIEENRPVFTVLEPVKIPIEKSKPKRLIILIVWILLGGVTATLYVTFKERSVFVKG